VRRGLPQQIAAGAIIVVVIVATAIAGVILSITDRPEGLLSAERPTATVFHIPTLSPVPTLITVVIPTQTPVVSATTTPTAAVVRTLTPTRTPVGTITPIPTATPRHRTPTPTLTPDPPEGGAAESCAVPSGWVPYTVQPGDNLFRVGLRYGETVGDLFDANCLSGATLEVGETLYVPPVTPMALPTAAPAAMASTPGVAPTGTQTATDGACSNPTSTITAPPVGAILSGVVPIRGSALLPNFRFYKLEIREEGASTSADFVTFYTAEQQVDNGLLLNFDTRAWPNGQYWIRLVVVDDTGNYPERCAILYTITN
jgi:LysM repeat protein